MIQESRLALLSRILTCPGCQMPVPAPETGCCTCGVGWKICGARIQFLEGAEERVVRPHTQLQRRWSRIRRHQYAFLKKEFAKSSRDAIVVDIGAGERQFQMLFDAFPQYIAMDMMAYPGIDVVTDLTKRWPILDGSVDIVVASNALEHFPETESILAECARILKPGGRLFIVVPFLMGEHQAPFDFVRHTHFSWERLAKRTGFTIDILEPSGTPLDTEREIREKVLQSISIEGTWLKRIVMRICVRVVSVTFCFPNVLLSLLSYWVGPKMSLAEGFQMVWRKNT